MKIRVLVYGTVQGVNFRSSTVIIANQLNISGTVRNLDNGSVEVIAEADNEFLLKFIVFLKKGPDGSKVDDLKIEEYEEKIDKGFKRI